MVSEIAGWELFASSSNKKMKLSYESFLKKFAGSYLVILAALFVWFSTHTITEVYTDPNNCSKPFVGAMANVLMCRHSRTILLNENRTIFTFLVVPIAILMILFGIELLKPHRAE